MLTKESIKRHNLFCFFNDKEKNFIFSKFWKTFYVLSLIAEETIVKYFSTKVKDSEK